MKSELTQWAEAFDDAELNAALKTHEFFYSFCMVPYFITVTNLQVVINFLGSNREPSGISVAVLVVCLCFAVCFATVSLVSYRKYRIFILAGGLASRIDQNLQKINTRNFVFLTGASAFIFFLSIFPDNVLPLFFHKVSYSSYAAALLVFVVLSLIIATIFFIIILKRVTTLRVVAASRKSAKT